MKLGNKKLLMIFVVFSLAVSAASGVLSINYGKLSDAALIADFSQMKTIAKTIAGAALILMVLVFINNRLEKKYFKQTMYDL